MTTTIIAKCLTLLYVLMTSAKADKQQCNKPNIVLILMDDAGWADFQNHDPEMRTPNIQKVIDDGLLLTQSYSLPMCAPSRAALLTGQYPHTFGAQNGKAAGTSKVFWVDKSIRLMPSELRDMGYTTHGLGKWHMGYCHPDLTPTGRGFDTFYGMMLGAHSSYYTHFKSSNGPYDWWENTTIDWSSKDRYSTEIISERAVKIINETEDCDPFFMYVAYPSPHGPYEVPQKYIDKYASHVTDPTRKIHSAMVSAVDEGIGNIIDVLKSKGLYDNTAILVTTDNGGPVGHGASNYPLRGGKKTLYEGGIRVMTTFRAPGMKSRGTSYSGMVHSIDWMPTFYDMAGGSNKVYFHGKSMWPSLRDYTKSPRRYFLLTYDDYYKFNHTGIRLGKWKLIIGKPGMSGGWTDTNGHYFDYKQSYDWGDIELYNIEKDPQERDNRAKLESKQAYIEMMKEKLQSILQKHPVQPFVESSTSLYWQDKEKNVLSICWCQPSDSDPCHA